MQIVHPLKGKETVMGILDFLIIAVGIGIGCAVLFNMAKETFKK